MANQATTTYKVTGTRKAVNGLLRRLLLCEVGLGIEVGITNDLFLDGLRREILKWQGKMLFLDGLNGEANTRVTLCYACVTWKILETQQFCPQEPMAKVMLGTMTMDGWGIGVNDTDIVEHSSLTQKILVGSQFGMRTSDAKSTLCHQTAMHEQEFLQLRILLIVFMDQRFWIHDIKFLFILSIFNRQKGAFNSWQISNSFINHSLLHMPF